jgi:hypothetical protein
MPLNFRFDGVRSSAFGVGHEGDEQNVFYMVPVDADVQTALQEMAKNTWEAIQQQEADGREYQPSEKYGAQEYVFLPLEHDLATRLRQLHEAANLDLNVHALSHPSSLFCYFASFEDRGGNHLTAVRRATQFKGIVRSRLVHIVSDSMKLVEDDTFRLDRDFDLLIDSNRVHILRYSGFEAIGQLQEAICAAVPANIAEIERDIEFIDFASISDYAQRHPRAARYLASIRGQRETQNISPRLLSDACTKYGINLKQVNGRIVVMPGSELEFLNVLDRSMYELELVEGRPERYRASSRQRVGN